MGCLLELFPLKCYHGNMTILDNDITENFRSARGELDAMFRRFLYKIQNGKYSLNNESDAPFVVSAYKELSCYGDMTHINERISREAFVNYMIYASPAKSLDTGEWLYDVYHEYRENMTADDRVGFLIRIISMYLSYKYFGKQIKEYMDKISSQKDT